MPSSAPDIAGGQFRRFRATATPAWVCDFRLATMAITIIAVIGGASFDVANERSKSLFGTSLRRAMASVVENKSERLLPA